MVKEKSTKQRIWEMIGWEIDDREINPNGLLLMNSLFRKADEQQKEFLTLPQIVDRLFKERYMESVPRFPNSNYHQIKLYLESDSIPYNLKGEYNDHLWIFIQQLVTRSNYCSDTSERREKLKITPNIDFFRQFNQNPREELSYFVVKYNPVFIGGIERPSYSNITISSPYFEELHYPDLDIDKVKMSEIIEIGGSLKWENRLMYTGDWEIDNAEIDTGDWKIRFDRDDSANGLHGTISFNRTALTKKGLARKLKSMLKMIDSNSFYHWANPHNNKIVYHRWKEN